MANVWTRGIQTNNFYNFGFTQLVALSAGQTILRMRFRWGFYADSSPLNDLAFVASNVLTLGFVTTIGNGSEFVPDARANSGDQAPPAERWLYWETRQPVVTSLGQTDGIVTWRDSGSTEETQTRAMVKAPIMGSGDTLNLWASWASPFAWDASGTATLFFGWEVLVRQ